MNTLISDFGSDDPHRAKIPSHPLWEAPIDKRIPGFTLKATLIKYLVSLIR